MKTVFLVLTCFSFWLTRTGHHIDVDHLCQIEPGMTQNDVERILGGPPGNYSWGGNAEYFGGGPAPGPEWIGDQISICPIFNKDGKVRLRCIGVVEYPAWPGGKLRSEFRLWAGLEKRVNW